MSLFNPIDQVVFQSYKVGHDGVPR